MGWLRSAGVCHGRGDGMNSIPAPVLLRALAAMEAVRDYLNDNTCKDPYVQLIKAQAELGCYVDAALKQTKVEVEA